MGGEVSRFVEEIDAQYLEMPSRRRDFPETGTLPRAFFNAGKPKQNTQNTTSTRSIQRPMTAAIPNSPAAINAILPGMQVRHEKFGIGKVLNIEGADENSRKAVVFFEGVGQKQLMLKFAKLTIVEN